MAIWLARLVMKLGKMLAALATLLDGTLAERVEPVGTVSELGVVWPTSSMLPTKFVKYKVPMTEPLPPVAVAVTGVVEPVGKNIEALLSLTCIEPVPNAEG
jgi:hypothetical protein